MVQEPNLGVKRSRAKSNPGGTMDTALTRYPKPDRIFQTSRLRALGGWIASIVGLHLFDRAARVLPSFETALDVTHGSQAHSLHRLCGQRRPEPPRTKENESLTRSKDLLVIRTFGIDPEFQHSARSMEGAGHTAVALEFTDIAQIDQGDVRIIFERDCLRRRQRLDLGISF